MHIVQMYIHMLYLSFSVSIMYQMYSGIRLIYLRCTNRMCSVEWHLNIPANYFIAISLLKSRCRKHTDSGYEYESR